MTIGIINSSSSTPIPGLDLRNMLDINEFKNRSTIYDNLGIPLSNRFACLLNAPKISKFKSNGWLEFQVLSVDCPGITLDTQKMELNGVNRYYFKGRSHDSLQISFLETSELTLRDFFYQWMQQAVNINLDGGVTRGYLEDIVAPDFAIMPLDFSGVARRVDRFRKVFPTKIQDMNYNYGSAGEVIKTTVTFEYYFHSVETVNMDKDGTHVVAQ